MPSDYTIHPAAKIFPPLAGQEYERLRDDIAANGQLESIELLDGQIIDGRNRYRVCKELELEPDVCELESCDDPVAYVLSRNLHRRQLKTSQRAMCAAKMAGLKNGQHAASNEAAFPHDDAAAMFQVGRSSVQRALDVIRNGSAYVQEQCELGLLSVSLVAKLIEAYPDKREHTKIAKQGAKAIREALGTTTKTKPKSNSIDGLMESYETLSEPEKESVVGQLDRFMEAIDERPAFERFRSLWDAVDDLGRAAIRAFVMEQD